MTTPSEPLYCEILLTKGQVALVDASDYDRLIQHRWCADWNSRGKKFYVLRKTTSHGKQTNIRMHREVLKLVAGGKEHVDHINGNTLDNRRSNLRLVTRSQNMCNRTKQVNNKSGYKGVRSHKASGKWIAEIGISGKRFYLGLHNTPEEAHAAYREAAKNLHGEFERTQ